jgi:glutathione S-transferase
MLTLYSFGPAANSLKPLLTLYEKGLEFDGRRLNPAQFEHHSEWYKAINPRGQVPALVDQGRVITESTVICEYLEDAHPTAVKLRPDNPADRAEMRVWTKWVDEYFCWCVSTIGWHRGIGPMARALSDADFEAHLENIPIPEQRVKWRRAREGFPPTMIEEEMGKIAISVRRLDDHLRSHEWLAGGMYTLADICNFAIANGMQRGYPELVNEADTPGILRWLAAINGRPAVQRVYAEVPMEKLG